MANVDAVVSRFRRIDAFTNFGRLRSRLCPPQLVFLTVNPNIFRAFGDNRH